MCSNRLYILFIVTLILAISSWFQCCISDVVTCNYRETLHHPAENAPARLIFDSLVIDIFQVNCTELFKLTGKRCLSCFTQDQVANFFLSI